jgi:intracellular septation protein A
VKQALWHLLLDLLAAALFLIAYAVFRNARIAAGAAVAAGFVYAGSRGLRGLRLHRLEWTDFALLLALGGATILTQTPRFMMLKPSFVHFGIAVAMSRRGWMIGYITPIARQNVPEPAMVAAGYGWAALMAALGLTNAVIALYCDLTTWAWFTLIGSAGAKLAALALQYATFRTIVRRRLAQSAA